jgi:hypothetical protein
LQRLAATFGFHVLHEAGHAHAGDVGSQIGYLDCEGSSVVRPK